jgi:hypothetical protein
MDIRDSSRLQCKLEGWRAPTFYDPTTLEYFSAYNYIDKNNCVCRTFDIITKQKVSNLNNSFHS